MALLGAQHTATGTAVALSTLVPTAVKQIDITANPGNSAVIYIGPSTVTAAGLYAYIALDAGQSWSAHADRGGMVELEASRVYVIGTASDMVHIAYVS